MLHEDPTEALNTILYHCPLLGAIGKAYSRAVTWEAINNIDMVTCGEALIWWVVEILHHQCGHWGTS